MNSLPDPASTLLAFGVAVAILLGPLGRRPVMTLAPALSVHLLRKSAA